MPVLETTTFKATAEYLNDVASAIAPVTALLKEAKGVIGFHGGKQVEDPTKGILIIVWDNIQSHKDLQTASNYLQFVDSFFKIVPSEAKDSIVSFHVDIPEPQFELFQSAIGYHTTEFATIAPKEGFDKSILEPGLNRMISHSSSRGACWGPITEEDGKQAVFYIGWSSLQEHGQFLSEHPELAQDAEPFMQIVSAEVNHAEFIKLI